MWKGTGKESVVIPPSIETFCFCLSLRLECCFLRTNCWLAGVSSDRCNYPLFLSLIMCNPPLAVIVTFSSLLLQSSREACILARELGRACMNAQSAEWQFAHMKCSGQHGLRLCTRFLECLPRLVQSSPSIPTRHQKTESWARKICMSRFWYIRFRHAIVPRFCFLHEGFTRGSSSFLRKCRCHLRR